MRKFGARLAKIGAEVEKRHGRVLGMKAFYWWSNKYHARRESEQQIHTERIKQKTFENLVKAKH